MMITKNQKAVVEKYDFLEEFNRYIRKTRY